VTCIFCLIVAGEAPSRRVFEDSTTLAFMDKNPATRGHALVIPKAHAIDIHDVPPETWADMARTAQRVAHAARTALGCAGVNLVQSSGRAAFQSVFHIHIHVVPRYPEDPLRLPWIPTPGDWNAIGEAGEALRAALVPPG
jgi:histidine triad (HIT) family protein